MVTTSVGEVYFFKSAFFFLEVHFVTSFGAD